VNVVLLRVGIDSGTGGAHGALFPDRSFEYIPIPDGSRLDERTYGNTLGRCGRPLVELLPVSMRGRMANQSMHLDPEFETYTYGDPSVPKAGLRRLQQGDLLVFYVGLQEPGRQPALHLIGYFEVARAGLASTFTDQELKTHFTANFHVRHMSLFVEQYQRLVLVKGGDGSRLLKRAVKISEVSVDRAGKPLKVVSREMQAIFGTFGGHISIQRSPPRWVDGTQAHRAAEYLRSLP
jgi:Nucleotide modification associated domain 3